MHTPLQWWRRSGWLGRVLVILVTLYVIYALVVFFILPGWLRDKGEHTLSDLLGRKVTIERLALNPLTLSATVENLSIQDPQTDTLVGFKRLYVNAEMWDSLFHWRPWVGDIDLDGLDVRLRRAADGALNIDDVIRRFGERGKPPPPKPKDQKQRPLPAFTIGHLSLTQGNFRFTDAAGDKPVTLTLPVAFKVDDFTTRTPDKHDNRYVLHIKGPDGGSLDWDGRFQVQPLTTEGHLAMTKVDLVSFARLLEPRFRFRLPSGQLGLGAHYHFSAAPGDGLRISQGALSLNNLKIVRQGNDKPSMVFPSIAVKGVTLDTAKQRLNVPEVTVSDPDVHAVRSAKGLDLATLFLPKNPERAKQTREHVKAHAKDTSKAVRQGGLDWRVSLQKLVISGAKASLLDDTLKQPASLALSDGALTVSDVQVGKAITWKWQGSATLAGSGHLQHSGEGQLAPLKVSADLDLKDLPLTALAPWVSNAVPLTVKQGRAGGQLKLAVTGAQPSVSITGSAGLAQVKLEERGQPFVSAKALNARGLNVDTGKHLAAVHDLAANGLDFINRIDKQGKDSVTRLAGGAAGDKQSTKQSGPGWRVRLDKVTVKDSRLSHHDASLSPPFDVSLQHWDGSLKGFDSAAGKAHLMLTGKVNGNAPLKAKGSVDMDPLLVDLTVSLNSYGMDNLTPYTGRYLGYAVQRGLLNVNSTLKINKKALSSDTEIGADRFYLGDSVASNQALNVPVKLSLAVLRDASGKIDLPLNVSGDMSDPSFSVAGLVFRVIRNVLVKAATSPFSLLASLVGGENLDQIDFPPGQAAPAAQTRQKLASLAQVLKARPALKVRIDGQAGAPDRQALARKVITDEMGGDWPGLDAALANSNWREHILDEFESRLGQDRDVIKVRGDGDTAQIARAREAWRRLMSAAEKQVDGQKLQVLAQQRAQAARRTLIKAYRTKAERISLGDVATDSNTSGIHLGLDSQ